MDANFQEKQIVLQATNLCKTFYNPAKIEILKNLDLTVRQGETVAIMGRSGKGKSTLLQILGTLETPCSGILKIHGEKTSYFNKSRIRNRELGFIFQSFHLLEDYTALENVLIPAKIARKSISPLEKTYKNAFDLLYHVGLGDRMHFHTKLLSGGEKQRVAIARALCNNPGIILADEPSGNLDKETSKGIHQLLIDLSRSQGKTLVIVTHDPDLAQMCSTRYTLIDGKLKNNREL